MEEKSFINPPKNDTPIDASITMESPSNIALVKYWGKKEIQIPTNPSISFTLKNCKTTTNLSLKKGLKKLNDVIVDGKTKHSFTAKICFLSTVISSSYLRRFSNKTFSDFGSLDTPSKPFFSAIFKLKILYSFPEDEMVSKDLKEFLLLNFMRYT